MVPPIAPETAGVTPIHLPPQKQLPLLTEDCMYRQKDVSMSIPSPPGDLLNYLSFEGKLRQQGTLRLVNSKLKMSFHNEFVVKSHTLSLNAIFNAELLLANFKAFLALSLWHQASRPPLSSPFQACLFT